MNVQKIAKLENANAIATESVNKLKEMIEVGDKRATELTTANQAFNNKVSKINQEVNNLTVCEK